MVCYDKRPSRSIELLYVQVIKYRCALTVGTHALTTHRTIVITRWSRGDGASVSSTSTDLTVSPSDLAGAGSLFTVYANISLNEASGVAAFSVPMNAVPYCPATIGKCLAVTSKHETFPDAEFLASASGFADDDDGSGALTYEWGVLDDRRRPSPLLIDKVSTFKFAGLPKGPTTIYVRAIDPQGAAVDEQTVVVVHDPPPNFSATSAVEAVNISNVVNVGDPAVINQAVQSIAALANFGLASDSSASESTKQALRDVVDTKGAALLVASAASVDKHDPEAAQTAAFSAASMVKVMNNVSEEAKGAALDIGKNRECYLIYWEDCSRSVA